MPFVATPYRVSTITATCTVGTSLDLDVLFQGIPIVEGGDDGVVYFEYGLDKYDAYSRGSVPKLGRRSRQRLKKKMKRFDGQATAIVCIDEVYTNVKVFSNGKLQMTGLKNVDSGKLVAEVIVQNVLRSGEGVCGDVSELEWKDYRVQLINSDFKVNYMVRRDLMYQYIVEHAGISCSYEPDIYPPVKLQFYLNLNTTQEHPGICECLPFPQRCAGKGNTAEGCKKVTVSIFQSGCIIITGGKCMEHIERTYHYICDLMKTAQEAVERRLLPS